MRTFLRQVSRGKVYGDPLGRERETDRRKCCPHPLAALRDGLVGQPDNVKAGRPAESWTWTSTARASRPRYATVATVATIQARPREHAIMDRIPPSSALTAVAAMDRSPASGLRERLTVATCAA